MTGQPGSVGLTSRQRLVRACGVGAWICPSMRSPPVDAHGQIHASTTWHGVWRTEAEWVLGVVVFALTPYKVCQFRCLLFFVQIGSGRLFHPCLVSNERSKHETLHKDSTSTGPCRHRVLLYQHLHPAEKEGGTVNRESAYTCCVCLSWLLSLSLVHCVALSV